MALEILSTTQSHGGAVACGCSLALHPHNLLFAYQTLCMSHTLAIALKASLSLTTFIFTLDFCFLFFKIIVTIKTQ